MTKNINFGDKVNIIGSNEVFAFIGIDTDINGNPINATIEKTEPTKLLKKVPINTLQLV